MGFCHWNLTYDTFLESLGPWVYLGMVSRNFSPHQGGQGGKKCPKNRNFDDFGGFLWVFVIGTSHMIPFWNTRDHRSTQEWFPEIFHTIRWIRGVKNAPKIGILMILEVFMGFLSLEPHI